MVTGRMTVCNFLFDSAYMVCGLTKFKMFYMHTDGAARNSIHCVHIFPAILKNNDASQRAVCINKIESSASSCVHEYCWDMKIMTNIQRVIDKSGA